ncbi:uncharacterized protein CELE_C43D7.7 [Caenorhabditis elegans]|uniref:Uncharacterized protein n=1 Tax=Caenorhabditis elegans TaxID=6239 RepID=Q9XVC0_CAEEL|nr:Uncharacterized protein CELE_C43D7.7 [Caenorhabditis elegans]CAB03960.1 Uncharacterized protein CELE_C43D7.7 [Caenorhabditis elegans]|eukprot:NP_507763.1 Uncharacterized protein CELE_C43D7.7 [Caenorhabditis elegans]
MELEGCSDRLLVSNCLNDNAIDNRKAFLFSDCTFNISQVAQLNLDSFDLSLHKYESLVLRIIAGHQAEIEKLQKQLAEAEAKTNGCFPIGRILKRIFNF